MKTTLTRPALISRREVLAGTGALIMSFSMRGMAFGQEPSQPGEQVKLAGSLQENRFLDAWIRIEPDNSINVFTGKVELGQGIRTALIQVAAEELDVAVVDITLVTADTALTPDEGFTAGSQSMQNSGTAIRHAAAQVRELLMQEAARRLATAPGQLHAENKAFAAPDGRRISYGELVSSVLLHVEAQPQSKLKAPSSFRVMGKPLLRVDIPPKVTGGVAYVHDLKLPGMIHARVIRPPSPAARLIEIDANAARSVSGLVAVVRDGSFLAVATEREFDAVKAMRMLASSARWQESPTLPKPSELPAELQRLEREVGVVAQSGAAPLAARQTLEATFTRPYQMHASIGPSCAVALLENDLMTIWSHTQGVYPDREAIAEMLAMPIDKVRLIHMEGSGCYGHNGADDAAADAALIARAVPGRPVRVQWTREQEHAWEPYGPAMVMKASASLDESGRIASWKYDVWSNPHSTRPGPAGALLPARHLQRPFAPEPAKLDITPSGNGDRNSVPLYSIPNLHVLWHFLPDMPLRVSALRALGAYANVFAIESMMDELALVAGSDPVEFRLRHLQDKRARDVVEIAAKEFGWTSARPSPGHGRGFGFARYKNLAAYLGVAVEAEVERETGRVRVTRATAAVDSGEIVNPDGIRNQTEGGIMQSISWTLYEFVSFDETRIKSVDWSTYPILRFGAVPARIDVHVVDRPGEPFLGTGEGAQGPAAGALANAIRDAIGVRLYDLPFTPDRVVSALRGQ
jgi:CO/xanthine dehydrogenase Mo-binding subunit